MKKTFAVLALSALAFVPATTAWADGSDVDPSGREVADRALATAPGVEGIVIYGCHEGRVFINDLSHHGTVHGPPCKQESIFVAWTF